MRMVVSSQFVDLSPGRVGQFECGPAVDAKAPSCAESCIEQNGAVIAQDPGLRKQRALAPDSSAAANKPFLKGGTIS